MSRCKQLRNLKNELAALAEVEIVTINADLSNVGEVSHVVDLLSVYNHAIDVIITNIDDGKRQ